MLGLISKKLLMAGAITIVLPWTAPAPSVAPATGFPIAANSGASSGMSFNWSGYEATGGTFTAVSGTWTVPAVAAATSTEADATWVGIGGISGQDLIQAGTQAVVDRSGTVSYQAWYEMLPQATQQVPLTVSAGDSMSASLTETSAGTATTPAQWQVTIRDNTTGQSYQASLAYSSSLSSAEWIEEMPSDGAGFVPLDNFGSVPFLNGMATKNGTPLTISGAGGQALTMVNRSGNTLASPSTLGSDGASFTVTRSATPVAPVSGLAGRGWRRSGTGPQGFTPTPAIAPWRRIFRNFQGGTLRSWIW
ncbi:MAG TPA: G1 family glutamic endopeptidase [Candidatus Paceibacterota bacterium]|nr:G1 family glutamic endopeptidase [Candidatus Paceibacterota bacterium]